MRNLTQYKGLAFIISIIVLVPLFTWCVSLAESCKTRSQVVHLRKHMDSAHERTLAIPVNMDEDIITDGTILDLLLKISTAESVMIKSYIPYSANIEEGLLQCTAELLMSGEFVPLIKTIRAIENGFNHCKIKSVKLSMENDLQTRTQYLTAQVYIQQLTEN